MAAEYSLGDLARSVQDWCTAHGVTPANGQVAEAISERTIRYYRVMDLVDAPSGPHGRAFTEKHRLQLIAVRLFQAQGLPLRKIREAVRGKSDAELRALVSPALRDRAPELRVLESSGGAPPSTHGEQWIVAPLDEDFLLVSRRGRPLSPELLARVRRALAADPSADGVLPPSEPKSP